jgi:probable rRNA maturation factor
MGRRSKLAGDRPTQNPLHVKFNVYNRQKALPISLVSTREVLQALASFLSIDCEEISVYFVTEKKICQLHADFFDDPSPTDCITFPIDSKYLGDIFVNPAAALTFDPKNPYKETLLYIVHGLLHLLEYDDLKPAPRMAMRKKEKMCMDHLNHLEVTLAP